MNKEKQAQLVLLYTLVEMGGSGTKENVLKHIRRHGYWKLTEENERHLPSRAEPFWEKSFAYKRETLASKGCIGRGEKNRWPITDAGRALLQKLTAEAIADASGAQCLYTDAFFKRLVGQEAEGEMDEERAWMAQLAEDDEEPAALPLEDVRRPRGTVSHREGGRAVYARSPAVARRALKQAQYRCQMDPAHRTFLRRDGVTPYVEPHHLLPMSLTEYFDCDLDREQNIFALCSYCHDQIHYGAKEDARPMVQRLFEARRASVCGIIGREINLEELYRIYGL